VKASEAKEITAQATKYHAFNGMRKILKIIKKSAKAGEHMAEICAALVDADDPQEIVVELKALGYDADFKYDNRDGNYYSVSWE
jgi:hypothetical protein